MKDQNNNKNDCTQSCDKKGLYIPKKELSWIIAALISTLLGVFLAGYFWGQRKAVSTLLEKIDKESFADKVTYSLYTMNGKYQQDENNEDDDQDEDDETIETPRTEQPTNFEVEDKNSLTQEIVVDEIVEKHEQEPVVTYMAPLVGFSSFNSANQFMQKIKKSGIDVSVKKRVSKTAKGKSVAWYQVITGEYTDKNEVEHVVMRLSEKENLKNVKIVEIKKG